MSIALKGALMAKRSAKERRAIVCAMLAEDGAPLSSFALSEREEKFYRARASKAIEAAVKKTARFRKSYSLPVAKPFRNVLWASFGVIVGAWATAGLFLWLFSPPEETPIFDACLAVTVVAIGWAVVGSLTHRNTIRQNTNNFLFARFSQTQFGDALYRFHRKFGFDEKVGITESKLDALRATGDEEDWRTASSVGYLLNYFELVANGVISGDLDERIVRQNFRGVIQFYHDKCWPIIDAARRRNHRTFSGLIRLKTYYDSLDELHLKRRRNITVAVVLLLAAVAIGGWFFG
jgi:hypothetical protein